MGPDFVMRGSTKPIFAMHGWAAPSWSEPRLRRADLRGAYLRLAKLDGADLSDANLSDAEGLTQAQLVLAHHNSGTKLPEGWTGLEADSPLQRRVTREPGFFWQADVSLARRRDHEGEILEVLVQRRRDRRAAVKLGRNRSGRVGQVYTILADALEPAPAERERRS